MRLRTLPDAAYLNKLFRYEPHTGHLYWKVAKGRATTDKPIGTRCGNYLTLKLNGKSYLIHRIIIKMMSGCDPLGEVDHIDNDCRNNQYANLRQVTKSENLLNRRGANRNSRTGILGVSHSNGRYRAKLDHEHKIYVKEFDTSKAAEQWLTTKRTELGITNERSLS